VFDPTVSLRPEKIERDALLGLPAEIRPISPASSPATKKMRARIGVRCQPGYNAKASSPADSRPLCACVSVCVYCIVCVLCVYCVWHENC
jgi:hypothetical protein